MKIKLIACRATGSILREETFEGRLYAVVPVVPMVEGVHQGIVGPNQPGPRDYYPAAVISNGARSLEGAPVTLGHPMTDTELVSASSAEGAPFVIGHIRNVRFAENKLHAEAWIDIARLTDKSAETLQLLQAGTPINVSLGTYGSYTVRAGVWNGEAYDGSFTEVSFDHLALLPGATGACSWADGCGVRVNETTAATPKETTMPRPKTPTAVKTSRLLVRHMEEFTAMEASHGEIRDQLWNVVNAMDTPEYVNYLRDTYDDYFIYETARRDPLTGATVASKLYKRGYTVSDKGVVTVAEAPAQEVVKKTEYVPVDTATTANATFNLENAVNKEELIRALIACDRTPFKEEHRPMLNGLTECQLELLKADNFKPAAAAPTTTDAAPAAPATPAAPVVVTAAAPAAEPARPVTLEEYLSKAPKEIASTLRGMMAREVAVGNALIEKITASQGCPFTKEELKLKDLGELQKLAALANVAVDVTVDYGPQAGAPRTPEAGKVPTMPSTRPEAPTK